MKNCKSHTREQTRKKRRKEQKSELDSEKKRKQKRIERIDMIKKQTRIERKTDQRAQQKGQLKDKLEQKIKQKRRIKVTHFLNSRMNKDRKRGGRKKTEQHSSQLHLNLSARSIRFVGENRHKNKLYIQLSQETVMKNYI